eukprot:1035586-Amphidinium_carterae.3
MATPPRILLKLALQTERHTTAQGFVGNLGLFLQTTREINITSNVFWILHSSDCAPKKSGVEQHMTPQLQPHGGLGATAHRTFAPPAKHGCLHLRFNNQFATNSPSLPCNCLLEASKPSRPASGSKAHGPQHGSSGLNNYNK